MNKPGPAFFVLCVMVVSLVTACGGETGDAGKPKPGTHSSDLFKQAPAVDTGRALAVVDGVPIYEAQLRERMSTRPGSTPRQALDSLVDDVLLAREALARDFGSHSDVQSELRKALALAFLSETAESYTLSDIPMPLLERRYEKRKQEFVHNVMRVVHHGLARTDTGDLTEAAAREVAEKLAELGADVVTPEAFAALVNQVGETSGPLKLEKLPPIEEGDTRFVKPFVDAVFAVDYPVKRVSPPVKTKYGWHVLFIVDETDASAISFEEALPELRRSLIEGLRKKRVEEVSANVRESSNVFIYDDVMAGDAGS